MKEFDGMSEEELQRHLETVESQERIIEASKRLVKAININSLPWSAPFSFNRCKAVKEPNPSGHYGRCELKRHDETINHALERGFDTPRWSTKWTS